MSLLGRRFRAQHLSGPKAPSTADAVAGLLAVQSQDPHAANWSLGQRVEGATASSIRAAFDDGLILRTHVLRPTWHYVTPQDIVWLLSLTSPRVQILNGTMYRQLGLDPTMLTRGAAIIMDSLSGHRFLTRTELGRKLKEGGVPSEKVHLAYVVMNAELEGLICSGPMRGKQHTYALISERAPHARRLEHEQALAEVAFRFFTGHGPATLSHLVWWSGLKVSDAKAGLAMVEGSLRRDQVGDAVYFSSPETPEAGDCTGAYLIPEYDEVLVGARDLEIPDNAPPRDGAADNFLRPILVDCVRVGTWKRVFVGDSAVLETSLVGSLTTEQKVDIRSAAGRYSDYLQMPVEVKGV